MIFGRVCLTAFLAAVGCLALGQQTEPIDLRKGVPPVTFDAWKEVAASDTMREYAGSFPSVTITEYPENNIVPIRAFVPVEGTGPRPVVLILHYWGARDLKVERAFAEQLARRQIASVIMTLPYHLGRAPAGRRSGELAIQPSPAQLRLTMLQAIQDVKRTVDFIETRPEFDRSKIGIAGTSLGALVAALAYGTESRFSYAAFILGGVDLAQILWNSSLLVEARDALRRRGFTEDRMRLELADVEPLTYLGSRKDSSAMIIGGKYDTVVPASSTQLLIDSFSKPASLWLETGHYGGIFVQSRILKEVSNYFEQEFSGKTYVAPKRVFVPTLRIGVQASTSSGFDIGVGVDFWKTSPRGGFVGTGLITPRGPQLFFGVGISEGLSIGVTTRTNKIGLGLLWSRVL